MNRTQITAASCLVLLAGLSFIQMREERKTLDEDPLQTAAPTAPVPAEARAIPVEEVVANYLTGLSKGNTAVSRLVTLAGVLDELDAPAYKRARIPDSTGETLAQAALKAAEEAGVDPSPETTALKRRLAVFLVSRTRGETSRAYALQVLGEGPEAIRTAILPHLGSPDGVGGKAVLAKVREIQAQVPGTLYPQVVRRLGGVKTIAELVAVMQSTSDWKVIGACATALQDTRQAAVLGPVLERLEQAGLFDKPARLPFVSGELLAAHLEGAEGSALRRGMRLIQARPSLARWARKALEKGLESSDAETRLAAASAIKRGVVGGHMKAEDAEKLLAGRIEKESEAVLKAELSSGLEQVRGHMETKQYQRSVRVSGTPRSGARGVPLFISCPVSLPPSGRYKGEQGAPWTPDLRALSRSTPRGPTPSRFA